MFSRYKVYYDGVLLGTIRALSEGSAFDKGCSLAGVSASAYSGRSSRLVKVVMV